MSKENVKKLFEKIQKDAELQKNYAEIMQASGKGSEKSLADKLVGLGKANGFEFTSKDLEAARNELIDRVNENGELDDNALSGVAGGAKKGGTSQHYKKEYITGSVMTLGLSCAISSIVAESNKQGGCYEESMTIGSQRNCPTGN